MNNYDTVIGLMALLILVIAVLAFGAYRADKKMNTYIPPPPIPSIPPSRPVLSDPDDPDDPIGPAGPVRVLPQYCTPLWANVLILGCAVLWGGVYLALQLIPYVLLVLGFITVIKWLV